MVDEPNPNRESQQEYFDKQFQERLEKKREKEHIEEAAQAEAARLAYLRRTGRTEYKP